MFLVNSGALEGRIDAVFYSANNTFELANNTKYPIKALSKIATMQRGRFSHRPRNEPKFFNGNYPFIQTGDVVKASIENGNIQFTQTLNDLGLTVSKLFSEKVLVITIAANIGDTAILNYPACFPDSLVAIKPKDEQEITLEYLSIYFKFLKNYLDNLAPQSAQKNINLQQLAPTPIVIPPIETQQKIVSLFSLAYENKKAKETEAKRLLEGIDGYLLEALGIAKDLPSLKDLASLKNHFFVPFSQVQGNRFDPFYHKKEFKDLENALQNGKYEVITFKNVITDLKNGVEIREYAESGFRYLRVTDLDKHNINDANMRFVDVDNIPDKIKLNKNCILVARSGSLGLVSIVTDELLNSILSSHIFKIELDTLKVKPEYLENYFRSILGQKQFFKNNNGGVIPEINQTALKSIKIPLPPLSIQQEIATHITHLRTRAKQLEAEAKAEIDKAKQEVERMILG